MKMCICVGYIILQNNTPRHTQPYARQIHALTHAQTHSHAQYIHTIQRISKKLFNSYVQGVERLVSLIL